MLNILLTQLFMGYHSLSVLHNIFAIPLPPQPPAPHTPPPPYLPPPVKVPAAGAITERIPTVVASAPLPETNA